MTLLNRYKLKRMIMDMKEALVLMKNRGYETHYRSYDEKMYGLTKSVNGVIVAAKMEEKNGHVESVTLTTLVGFNAISSGELSINHDHFDRFEFELREISIAAQDRLDRLRQ